MWNFFDKISPTQSKCKHCGSKVNIKAGNTSTMKKHLKMHAVEYAMEEDLDLEGEVEVFHKKTRLEFDSDWD